MNYVWDGLWVGGRGNFHILVKNVKMGVLKDYLSESAALN